MASASTQTPTGESQATVEETGRPDDCECLNSYKLDEPLPCWPCCREGFEVPNASPPADD